MGRPARAEAAKHARGFLHLGVADDESVAPFNFYTVEGGLWNVSRTHRREPLGAL